MVTIAEFCEIFKVTRQTVNNWINNDKLKAVKINGIVRIPLEEVERLKKGE